MNGLTQNPANYVRSKMAKNNTVCSVCQGDFSLDEEGGITGEFGILPVAFCPTCLACMMDMAEQRSNNYESL